jgi:hypothetical protein
MAQLVIGDCVRDGWNGFKKNAGSAIGIILVFGLITSVGNTIPVINAAVAIALTPVLSGGLSIFALKVLRGGDGSVADLFDGFNRIGSFIGAYWLMVATVIGAFIPALIGFGIDFAIFGSVNKMVPYTTIALGIVSFITLIILILRFSMVFYLIVDGMKVIEAYKESARITKGFTGKLFLLSAVWGLIILLGVLLIFVGLLAAIPVTMLAYAAAYPRLKVESTSAPAVATAQ